MRELALGPAVGRTAVSLAEARRKARGLYDMHKDGRDPLEERAAARALLQAENAKTLTFAEAAARYIEAHRAGWRNAKHAQQWENTIGTYAEPVFGALSVQKIDATLVLKVLESIWTKKPETASRLRGRIERILDWAKVRGHRDGENPARWRGHLDHLLAAPSKVRQVKHHEALAYTDIASFMAALREQRGTAARALEFAILTAGRRSEALGAVWDEIDLKAGVWTVPAARMKARKQHRVPLSDRAIEILKQMQAQGGDVQVFAGRSADGAIATNVFHKLLHRMGHGGLTVHGFRSTFRDWAAERTNYPNHVVEMALAHTIPNAAEAAYRRGDLFEKRRRLMDDWATFCAQPAAEGERVMPIRQRPCSFRCVCPPAWWSCWRAKRARQVRALPVSRSPAGPSPLSRWCRRRAIAGARYVARHVRSSPKADIRSAKWNVRFGPIADIAIRRALLAPSETHLKVARLF
jgi:integrase